MQWQGALMTSGGIPHHTHHPALITLTQGQTMLDVSQTSVAFFPMQASDRGDATNHHYPVPYFI